jgi:hypothetical protein
MKSGSGAKYLSRSWLFQIWLHLEGWRWYTNQDLGGQLVLPTNPWAFLVAVGGTVGDLSYLILTQMRPHWSSLQIFGNKKRWQF